MTFKKIKGMNVEINKIYELLLAFHATYVLKHPEAKEELDFIETPNNEYMKQLCELINPDNYQCLCKYIMSFTDCSTSINISIGLNEKYEIDESKIELEQIKKNMSYGNIYDFCGELKNLAETINWDTFFENHRKMYEEFVNEVAVFPNNLDLKDIEKFYSVKTSTYTFIPSMLMNGGFGPADKLGNLYYVMGYIYNEENKQFSYDKEYNVECLFHEFSHPIVNPLVDKYIKGDILDKFHELSVNNNLPSVYSGDKKSVFYEYLVRANAYILASKYFKEIEPIENCWINKYGFTYLPDLVYFTLKNFPKYNNYEEFIQYGVLDFFESFIKKSNQKNKTLS